MPFDVGTVHVPDAVVLAFLAGGAFGVLFDRYGIPWLERVADRITLARLRLRRRGR